MEHLVGTSKASLGDVQQTLSRFKLKRKKGSLSPLAHHSTFSLSLSLFFLRHVSYQKCTYRECSELPQKRTEKSNLRVFILPCLRREPIRERGRTVAPENSAKIKSLIPVTRFGDIFGAVLGFRDFFFCLCSAKHIM